MGRSDDQLPGDVGAWGTVSFFSDLGHETVTALLPALLMAMGAPPVSLGVIEGLADGAAALTKLASGRMADRLHRLKPAAIAGYITTGLAMPAIGLAHSWPAVLGLRTVAWLGKGWRGPLRDTLLDRAVPPHLRGRAFGTERALDQLGAVLAPLLVVALLQASLSPRSIMLWAAVPGCAAALWVGLLVREQARPADVAAGSHGPRPATPTPAGTPAAAPAAEAAQAGTVAAPSAATAPLPGALRRLLLALAVFGSGDYSKTLLVLWALGPASTQLPTATISRAVLLYAGYNLVTSIVAWVSGRLSDRWGRKPTLLAAYSIGACGSLVPVFSSPTPLAAALALALAGVLVGAEEALERAWTADLTPAGRRGWAFGLVHAINGVGDLIASIGIGLLWTVWGAEVAFAAAAILMGVGTILAATVPGGVRPAGPSAAETSAA